MTDRKTAAATASAGTDLAPLLAIVNKPVVTSAEVEGALAGAREAQVAAQADHDRADADYKGGLLKSDEGALRKFVEAKNGAIVRRDRAGALVEALEARLVDARRAEDDVGRTAVYATAKTKTDVAVKALRERYPVLRRQLIELLRTVAEADIAVAAANAALPAGAEHLIGAEFIVRGTAGLPKETLSETTADLWCKNPEVTPLGELLQSQVKLGTDGRSGYLGPSSVSCTRRRFIKRTVLPRTYTKFADPLAQTIVLPGLGAETAFDLRGHYDAQSAIFQADAALIEDSGAKLTPPDRQPVVEFEYVPAPPPAKVKPVAVAA